MNGDWIILDTNIVSYLMKGAREARMYETRVRNKLLAISFITVGEFYYGAEKSNWGEKKRKWLDTTLRRFVVIPYDHEIARDYGRLMAERQRIGKAIALNDAWIAACALRHDVPLVTYNARHFEGIPGLRVISEWSPAGRSPRRRHGPNWT